MYASKDAQNLCVCAHTHIYKLTFKATAKQHFLFSHKVKKCWHFGFPQYFLLIFHIVGFWGGWGGVLVFFWGCLVCWLFFLLYWQHSSWMRIPFTVPVQGSRLLTGKLALYHGVTIRRHMLQFYNKPDEITQLLLLIFHKYWDIQ